MNKYEHADYMQPRRSRYYSPNIVEGECYAEYDIYFSIEDGKITEIDGDVDTHTFESHMRIGNYPYPIDEAYTAFSECHRLFAAIRHKHLPDGDYGGRCGITFMIEFEDEDDYDGINMDDIEFIEVGADVVEAYLDSLTIHKLEE